MVLWASSPPKAGSGINSRPASFCATFTYNACKMECVNRNCGNETTSESNAVSILIDNVELLHTIDTYINKYLLIWKHNCIQTPKTQWFWVHTKSCTIQSQSEIRKQVLHPYKTFRRCGQNGGQGFQRRFQRRCVRRTRELLHIKYVCIQYISWFISSKPTNPKTLAKRYVYGFPKIEYVRSIRLLHIPRERKRLRHQNAERNPNNGKTFCQKIMVMQRPP